LPGKAVGGWGEETLWGIKLSFLSALPEATTTRKTFKKYKIFFFFVAALKNGKYFSNDFHQYIFFQDFVQNFCNIFQLTNCITAKSVKRLFNFFFKILYRICGIFCN
jgi:hypothetical protein